MPYLTLQRPNLDGDVVEPLTDDSIQGVVGRLPRLRGTTAVALLSWSRANPLRGSFRGYTDRQRNRKSVAVVMQRISVPAEV